MNGRKNKRARACDIPDRVKHEVWERDGGACVLCHGRTAAPNAHYISRANGGKGVPENTVTLCTSFGNGCHNLYDNGTKEQREAIRGRLRAYLMEQYPGWNEDDLIYRKWG